MLSFILYFSAREHFIDHLLECVILMLTGDTPCVCCRYAMSFAANYLKKLYVKRTPESIKTIHVVSSAFKPTLTWHNMRTLQVVTTVISAAGHLFAKPDH